MTILLAIVVGVIGCAGWVGAYLWRRRQDRETPVSPSWLADHGYSRDGDDRQWK
jgi:hypothetical protein